MEDFEGREIDLPVSGSALGAILRVTEPRIGLSTVGAGAVVDRVSSRVHGEVGDRGGIGCQTSYLWIDGRCASAEMKGMCGVGIHVIPDRSGNL